jgi:hypothetical protein
VGEVSGRARGRRRAGCPIRQAGPVARAASQSEGQEALKKAQIIRFNPPDVLAYVLSENLHRRQLTPGQRAFVGEAIATLKPGKPQLSDSGQLQTLTREQLRNK